MTRKSLLLLFIVTITLLFSACDGNKDDSLIREKLKNQDIKGSNEKKYTIALVMKTLTNPFFVEMEKGARKAEKEFGIDLIIRTGAKETSIEQQIQIIDELITQKVDAIVIAPGSSTQLVKVLKLAQNSGIKIVNIDNRLDEKVSIKEGLKDVPFISVKNDEGAYQSAKVASKLVKKPTQAIIIEGIRDADNAQKRKEGAQKAFEENPNIKLVASESANWKIDEAYNLCSDLLKKYPETGVIFCANDMMALGAIQYLKEAKLKGVLVAGFDNLEDARKAIEEGWMTVSIDQQADLQGYTGIEAAIKLLQNKKVDMETYVPVRIITASNIKK